MALKQTRKILFLSPYPFDKAPSQRLKYEQYYRIFEKEGYLITTSSFMDEELWSVIYKKGFFIQKVLGFIKGYYRRIKDFFRLRQFDLVYIHLWVTPIGGSFFERLFAKCSKRMVFDIDDMVFLGHSSEANIKLSFLKGKSKPMILMKKADHVITCTPKLDEFVRQFNQNTTDISSTINTDLYVPKSDYHLSSPIIIGWSGSHSTSKYLHLLSDVFLRLQQRFQFVLKVIGDADFKIESIDVQALEWIAKHEVEELKTFDIGVYPLPDEEWVYGKSGLKALQYMSLGIPTVATNIGANKRIIKNGENGFLVQTEEEWIESISNLVDDKILRRKISSNAIQTVQNNFSVQANKNKYLYIFKSLIEQ